MKSDVKREEIEGIEFATELVNDDPEYHTVIFFAVPKLSITSI